MPPSNSKKYQTVDITHHKRLSNLERLRPWLNGSICFFLYASVLAAAATSFNKTTDESRKTPRIQSVQSNEATLQFTKMLVCL